MTHSIKKLLRRHGEPGIVKAKKVKRREPVHPGHKVMSVNAKRRQVLAEGTTMEEEPHTLAAAGTAARAAQQL